MLHNVTLRDKALDSAYSRIINTFQPFTYLTRYICLSQGCHRESCKFLHMTKEQEDYIRDNGNAPPGMSEYEADKLMGLVSHNHRMLHYLSADVEPFQVLLDCL